jgi:hypothetical protein
MMRTYKQLGSKGIVGLLLAGGVWAACGRPDVAPDPGRDWDGFRDRFVITEFETFPDMAVYEGRHEFDGKLPDWSAAGLSRTIAWLHSTRDAAAAFPAASLDAHLRSRVPELHAGQADDPEAARRLDRHARRTIRLEGLP